jgi:hypothetical protein
MGVVAVYIIIIIIVAQISGAAVFTDIVLLNYIPNLLLNYVLDLVRLQLCVYTYL